MTPEPKKVETPKEIVERIFRHQPVSELQKQCLQPFIENAIIAERKLADERVRSIWEKAVKIAEGDDYIMFLKKEDVLGIAAGDDERIARIRKQARMEVADKIRRAIPLDEEAGKSA